VYTVRLLQKKKLKIKTQKNVTLKDLCVIMGNKTRNNKHIFFHFLDCNKYFFIPEAFVLHLNMHHTNITSGFKCHICQSLVHTVESLIEVFLIIISLELILHVIGKDRKIM
jgi:hypothetical protein